MSYSIDCSCGKNIEVSSSQAGSEIVCSCGKPLTVPRLSELRKSVGLGAYETGIVDTINRMITQGELPGENICAYSGMPTTDVLIVIIQYEQRFRKTEDSEVTAVTILLGFFIPFWWFFKLFSMIGAGRIRTDDLGRDSEVKVPLRVCKEFHKKLARGWSRNAVRKMLKAVPIYNQLLDEYPKSVINPHS